MRYYAGKALELVGMIVTLMALMAGTGMTPSGRPNIGNEYLFLFLGIGIFMAGWLLERGGKKP